MKTRHINIPIFIPHMGCKNQCVFCNQRTISGVKEFDISNVRDIIEQSLSTKRAGDIYEIAYFGGSFTGIDRKLMINLLEIAYDYIKSGDVSAIRCSTRPDYIDNEILDILKKYGVTTIELGLQSTSDEVLKLSKRGHTYESERRACERILAGGFTLGGQMMIGLPGSDIVTEIKTARTLVELGCTEARIYPTIVFSGTELCNMAISGEYKPLDIDNAVKRSAAALEILLDAGIKILRIGLCESEGLHDKEGYFSGPAHPAIGEMVLSEVYFNRLSAIIDNLGIKNCTVNIECAYGAVSKTIGHKGRNKERILEKYGIKINKVIEANMSNLELRISKFEEGKVIKCI